MSIASSETVKVWIEHDGSLIAHLRFTASTGEVFDWVPRLSSGTDVDAVRLQEVARYEEVLAIRETNSLIEAD